MSSDLEVKSEDGTIDPKIEDDMSVIIKKEEEPEQDLTTMRANTQRPNRRKSSSKQGQLTGIKNVVKNYGKAMCSFASSEMAAPYLAPILEEEKASSDEFVMWIQNNKERVDSIESLRALLLATVYDEPKAGSYKRIFQKISIIFLKFFCINWIYSGKLTHKQTHLFFRLKMLRRVKRPEMFTHLQNPRRNRLRI